MSLRDPSCFFPILLARQVTRAGWLQDISRSLQEVDQMPPSCSGHGTTGNEADGVDDRTSALELEAKRSEEGRGALLRLDVMDGVLFSDHVACQAT